jgi:soluble lytic murein transglycosylase-like protein
VLAAPPPTALQLIRADAAFRAALVGWDSRRPMPQAAIDAVAREQVIELRLERDARVYRVVIPRLPPRLRRDVVDDVAAHRELVGMGRAKPRPARRLVVGPALPLARLRAYYREAQRRFGIPWRVLAAINYVETSFGRLREPSVAGALGPMQFMPATWAAYGQGDVHDPYSAILAAARYLRAVDGPADLRGAVHHYNPSDAYVDAVFRYVARIEREPLGLASLYARRVIVPTAHGYRRLNGRS